MAIKLSSSSSSARKTSLTIPATTTFLALIRPHDDLTSGDNIMVVQNAGVTKYWRIRAAAANKIQWLYGGAGEDVESVATVAAEQWNLLAACVDAGDTGKVLVSVNGEAWVAGDDIVEAITQATEIVVEGNESGDIDFAEVLVVNGKVPAASLAAMYAAIGDYGPNLTGLTQIYRDRLLSLDAADMTMAGTYADSEVDHPYELTAPANFQARSLMERGKRVATREWTQAQIDALQAELDALVDTVAALPTDSDVSSAISSAIASLASVAYVDGEIGTLAAAAAAAYAPIAKGVENHAADIGNGSDTAITVTHSLNSRDVHVAVWDKSTNVQLFPALELSSVDAAVLTFDEAPASSSVRVVIWKRTG